MATYKAFTKAEFEAALPPRWEEAPDVAGHEVVYRWKGRGKYVRWDVLCYSGVLKALGVSRDKGADAIRFVLLDTVSGKGVGKTTRVHRTGDVASLTERMDTRIRAMGTMAQAQEPLRCGACGAATVERVNRQKGTTFRGCLRYPVCRGAGGRNGVGDPDRINGEAPEDGSPEPPTEPVLMDEYPPDEVPTKAIKFFREAEPVIGAEVVVIDVDPTETTPTSAFAHLTFPYTHFNPLQSLVLPFVDQDVNLVVAAPTSAGKTVVAELMIAQTLTGEGQKGLFLSPLKAVTQEKYDEWQVRFRASNLSIVTGDYQLTKKRQAELAAADIILLTSEMLDSRTRRMRQENNGWLLDAGVLVCDEAHLLTVEDRGPALECGLVRFTQQNPNARLVLLSATMPNVDELGAWVARLNGKRTIVIKSTWRPVPHEVHYLPHPSRGRYRQIEDGKIRMVQDLVTRQHPDDRWLIFVHSKGTGRQMLQTLRDAGVEAEFHSADLDKATRLRVEAEFRKR